MSADPIAPAWLVLPLAMVAMVLVAGYLIALREAPEGSIAPSRRRIRTLSSWLMMLAIPMLACGFGVLSPSETRPFVLVWSLATGLLGLIVFVALLDMGDSIRLRHLLGKERKKLLAEARAIIERAAKGEGSPELRLAGLQTDAPPGDDASCAQ